MPSSVFHEQFIFSFKNLFSLYYLCEYTYCIKRTWKWKGDTNKLVWILTWVNVDRLVVFLNLKRSTKHCRQEEFIKKLFVCIWMQRDKKTWFLSSRVLVSWEFLTFVLVHQILFKNKFEPSTPPAPTVDLSTSWNGHQCVVQTLSCVSERRNAEREEGFM